MDNIHTEIEIGASADRVWEILTAFKRYPDWNPFMRWVRGQAEVGRPIAMRINPPSARPSTMHGRVTDVRPRQRLAWSSTAAVPGMLRIDNLIELVPTSGGRVLVRHSERVEGALSWLHWNALARCHHAGANAMNRALKQKAET